MKVQRLETARLILREWRKTDKLPFFKINSDPSAMEFFPKLLNREESDAVADRIQNFILEKGWGFWAVEDKSSGEFIGFTGLYIPTFESYFTPCVEIGWRLLPNFWNKGYATEAAMESLRFGFDELKLDEIVSMTAVQNIRSQNVMKKIGMTWRAEDVFDHPKVPVESGLTKHLLFRKKKEG